MFDAPINGLQDVNTDNSKPTYKTSRKTKLTLRQIRKLRRMLDVRNYEKNNYRDWETDRKSTRLNSSH